MFSNPELNHAQLIETTLRSRPLEVTYYGQDGDDPYDKPLSRMDSHGGWIASAADLARFADE